jgi:membrane protease YdiL (CAAX protease family)
MTTPPPPSAPLPPPDAGPLGRTHIQRERPWWSEIDALLAIVWFMGAMIVATIVTLTATSIGGGDVTDNPVYALFFGTAAFQILQATYPWLVSHRKGLGIEEDWHFVSSLPNDIYIGLLLALGCFVGAQVATLGAAALVGLDNTDDASNTDILVDNQSSPWIFGIIFLVVVGAPLAEELLFRGLILRVFQKSYGSVFAVLASSLLFAIPHWQPDASWQETVVLLSALTVVGLVLAIGAVVTDRLGPSVIAHFLFNATGTLLTFSF